MKNKWVKNERFLGNVNNVVTARFVNKNSA
jgi:hypothetical protein